MKRKDTLSLGELRELTKDLPDDTAILINMGQDTAVAVHIYPVETSLDSQGVFLLDFDPYNSVTFVDY